MGDGGGWWKREYGFGPMGAGGVLVEIVGGVGGGSVIAERCKPVVKKIVGIGVGGGCDVGGGELGKVVVGEGVGVAFRNAVV